jgi:uncharacterized protein with HEPN domain
MLPKSDQIRIRHMADAAQKALNFTKGKTRPDLDEDDQMALATVRLIEIIGEAAAKITPETREAHPVVPWNDIVGTRNRLIHGYEDVDLNIVWQIVKEDLPDLLRKLLNILGEKGMQGELLV